MGLVKIVCRMIFGKGKSKIKNEITKEARNQAKSQGGSLLKKLGKSALDSYLDD